MRKTLALLLGAALAAGPSALAQGGDGRDVLFDAPPCVAACAIFVATSPPYVGQVTCNVGADPVWQGWDDVSVVAPEGASYLRFQIYPEVDWDSMVCAPDGTTLGIGANTLGSPCRSTTAPPQVPVGCAESTVVQVTPGETYILRAYNWADPFPAPGNYLFSATRPPDWD